MADNAPAVGMLVADCWGRLFRMARWNKHWQDVYINRRLRRLGWANVRFRTRCSRVLCSKNGSTPAGNGRTAMLGWADPRQLWASSCPPARDPAPSAGVRSVTTEPSGNYQMTDRTDDAPPPPRREPAGFAPSRRGLLSAGAAGLGLVASSAALAQSAHHDPGRHGGRQRVQPRPAERPARGHAARLRHAARIGSRLGQAVLVVDEPRAPPHPAGWLGAPNQRG